MWVHRSGELYREKPVVLYEYQKTRNSSHPKEFYKDYKGILVTDGLEQYHKIERELPGLRNANCWAHARRDYADAVRPLEKAARKRCASRQRTRRWQGSARFISWKGC